MIDFLLSKEFVENFMLSLIPICIIGVIIVIDIGNSFIDNDLEDDDIK